MTNKKEALNKYKETKKRYLETLTSEDWIEFCKAKRACRLLGIIF